MNCPSCYQPFDEFFCKKCQIIQSTNNLNRIFRNLGERVFLSEKEWHLLPPFCIWREDLHKFAIHNYVLGNNSVELIGLYPNYNTPTKDLFDIIDKHLERQNKLKAFM